MGEGCFKEEGQLDLSGFGQGPEGGEEGNHTDIRKKNDPGKGHSLSKGPEAGPCLACLRNSERAWCVWNRVSKGGSRGNEAGGPCGLRVRTWAITGARERQSAEGWEQRRHGTDLDGHRRPLVVEAGSGHGALSRGSCASPSRSVPRGLDTLAPEQVLSFPCAVAKRPF